MAITHREIVAIRDEASAMREDALDMRLRAWLMKLEHGPTLTREATMSWALDAALSVEAADYGNIQLVGTSGHTLSIIAERGFHAPETGVSSVKTTPIVTKAGRLVGMLSVHFKEPQPGGDTRWARLRTVAAAVALSID